MKVVMTLLVGDEADIVDHQIRYHLDQGVDFVIATDHRSTDGTTEILERHERAGALHLIREDSLELHQGEWVTRMARLAATEYGADWVVNADADEFFWPREGSFHEVLAAVPARFGAVRALWRHFVLRPDRPGAFYERMTVRRAPVLELTNPYHPQVKVLHRGDGEVVVSKGNHDAWGRGLGLIREWYPFEVLHFPIRDREQLRRKYLPRWEARPGEESDPVPRHIHATATSLQASAGDEVYRSFLVDDEAVAAGVADGSLVVDTRLRDVLRQPGAGAATRPRPSPADDAAYAVEIDELQVYDSGARLKTRTDAVERRLAALEATRLLLRRGGRRTTR